jgi:hypothetical protein
MAAEDRYAQFAMERATPPPLTSGERLHWDGGGIASRDLGLTPVSAPGTCAAVPAQGQLVAGARATLPITTQQRGHLAVSPALAGAWAMEAAGMTFYLAPALLVTARYDGFSGATGTLVWVCEAGHGACLHPAVHPALLVQTASISLQRACVELVPHLSADDPLRHHMVLVLKTAFEAESVASRLYAASLADALALHFLRRYAACRPLAPAMPDRLSPAKLRRTIAYIQGHQPC